MNIEELNRAVAEIPEESRRLVARWLLARARGYQPSMFLDESYADLIQGVIIGVAVDMIDPESEDVTTPRAARIIQSLQE